jgi:hypothetical protein
MSKHSAKQQPAPADRVIFDTIEIKAAMGRSTIELPSWSTILPYFEFDLFSPRTIRLFVAVPHAGALTPSVLGPYTVVCIPTGEAFDAWAVEGWKHLGSRMHPTNSKVYHLFQILG